MRIALGIVAVAFLGACQPRGPFYTLYRSSVTDPRVRLHIATFDTANRDEYNRDNCQIAAELFAKQLGVVVRHWCEKGGFRT